MARWIVGVVVMAGLMVGAGATTGPADSVESLRAEVARLRRENSELRKRLAVFEQATTQPVAAAVNDRAIAQAIKDHKIIRGMTRDQAERALGHSPSRVTKHESGEKWEWEYHKVAFDLHEWRYHWQSGSSNESVNKSISAVAVDGVIVEVSEWQE